MNVKTTDLGAIANRLFEYLRETGRDDFDIAEDYYWEIPKDELYDPSKDPEDLRMGQLSEDWQNLKAIQRGEDPPVGYALVWLASILRNVGENSAH